MKLLTTTLFSATALAVMTAGGASAQDYRSCEDDREGRQVAGALIGGILGAVIGNELADDSNNNRRGYDRRDHRGRYGHGRRGHGRHAYHHRDRGNAEEVGTIAGAGVGALIGAAVAGGEDCDNRRYGQQRYDQRYDRYPGKPDHRGYQDSHYEDPYYEDDYRYAGSDDYGYSDQYDYRSDGELLGGSQSGTTRVYQASSGDWNCRWQQTRRMGEFGQQVTDQVYVCQGSDGIWRPREAYLGN